MNYLALLIPIVTLVAVFTFVSIASWSENRRKERETYYREETYRKLLESPPEGAERMLGLLREERERQAIERIQGLKIGGLVTGAVGIGLMIFLGALVRREMVFLVGVIPLLIGVALLVSAWIVGRSPAADADGRRR